MLSEKLHELGRHALEKATGRLIPAPNLHLTLTFLGPFDDERRVCCETAIDGFVKPSPFVLSVDRLGCWRRRGLLWAGCSVESPVLSGLAAAVNESLTICGHAPDTREFKTHITLARNVRHYAGLVRHGDERRRGDPLDAVAPLEWAMEEIRLMASELHPEGARYQTLRSWKL